MDCHHRKGPVAPRNEARTRCSTMRWDRKDKMSPLCPILWGYGDESTRMTKLETTSSSTDWFTRTGGDTYMYGV